MLSPPHTGTEILPAHQYHYGVLIDAGSTGSRAYLYRWHPRIRTLYSSLSSPSPAPRRPFSRPDTLPGWSVKTMPGLSDYAAAPARVAEALRPLVAFVISVMRQVGVEAKIPETPIYLKVRVARTLCSANTAITVTKHEIACILLLALCYFYGRLYSIICTPTVVSYN